MTTNATSLEPVSVEDKSKPKPATQPSPADAAALDWYFGPGQAAFERSTFGAMLEAAEREAYVTRTCANCTAGIIDATGAWCDRCNGTGSVPVRKPRRGAEPTVRVTRHREEVGFEPEDWQLRRYARVSRRLDALNPTDVAVLAAYHGDQGARWGATKRGRLFAVYALTKAGARLLRAAQRRTTADLGLSASDSLGVVADVNDTQPKAERRADLAEARIEAERMLTAAWTAWCASGPVRGQA